MTWNDLYSIMKDALDVFGLRWKDRDKVVVKIENDKIIFSYREMEMHYKLDATRWEDGYDFTKENAG